jgi:hypothetical protein
MQAKAKHSLLCVIDQRTGNSAELFALYNSNSTACRRQQTVLSRCQQSDGNIMWVGRMPMVVVGIPGLPQCGSKPSINQGQQQCVWAAMRQLKLQPQAHLLSAAAGLLGDGMAVSPTSGCHWQRQQHPVLCQ